MPIIEYFLSCLICRPKFPGESDYSRLLKISCVAIALILLGCAVASASECSGSNFNRRDCTLGVNHGSWIC